MPYVESPLDRIVNVHWGGIQAIHFNGLTYLDPHGFLALPNVPKGTASVWMRNRGSAAYDHFQLIAGFAFQRGFSFGDIGGSSIATAIGPDSVVCSAGGAVWSDGSFGESTGFLIEGVGYSDTIYHHFLWSWDSGTQRAQVVVDGVFTALSASLDSVPAPSWGFDPSLPGDDVGAPYTASQYLFAADTAAPIFECDIADFWFNLGVEMDLSDPTVVAKFVNTATGTPAELGAHGELPLGSLPHVFLHARGAPSDFATNLGSVLTVLRIAGVLTFADPKVVVRYKEPA